MEEMSWGQRLRTARENKENEAPITSIGVSTFL